MRIAVLLCLLAAPAYAQSMSAMSPADKDFMTGMAKMNQDMNAPMTGETDHDFVTMMIPHHQGAIDMAKVELQYGTDPALKHLAHEIVAAQDKEIAFMQKWLAAHPSP